MSLKMFSEKIDIGTLPLKYHPSILKLDRLVLGVDNVRFDVHLSKGFYQITKNFIFQLIAKHGQITELSGVKEKFNWIQEIFDLKRLYRELLQDAINKARIGFEIQIDYLAQIAIATMVIKEVPKQFETCIRLLNDLLRENELHSNHAMIVKIKNELSSTLQNQGDIIFKVRSDIFQYFSSVDETYLNELRSVNFGNENILPKALFLNPMLLANNPMDDTFLVNQYILLGHHLEDPIRYNTMVTILKSFFLSICKTSQTFKRPDDSVAETLKTGPPPDMNYENTLEIIIDDWMKHSENIDILFNYIETKKNLGLRRKKKSDTNNLPELKKQYHVQKKLAGLLFKKIEQQKLTEWIPAIYIILSVYHHYCPPMSPQDVLKFVADSKSRKLFKEKLNRSKKAAGKSFSLTPLWKSIRQLEKIPDTQRKKYYLQFIKDFVRYHKDFSNFNLFREAMNCINLISEEKLIKLSKANNTLYEFLLPNELTADEGQIVNHVVIKADVRGSTDIVHQMKLKGLNPASNFSLNFFDPITEILSKYGATKVFIEGDAIILSIFENEHDQENWYCVSRACGLAVNILHIVEQYNKKNLNYRLPMLVLGIGIGFSNGAPTFFFDGDNRIMISHAIHLADRLSRCEKSLRKLYVDKKRPFNLYLFQTVSDKDIDRTADDLFLRYNVKGINLSVAGFTKLSKEIKLDSMECSLPELVNEKIRIHTGRFPTVPGKYQRLIIREAYIPEVYPEDLKIKKMTLRKYYEVCTNRILLAHVKKKLGETV